jgi:hypothetical protein
MSSSVIVVAAPEDDSMSSLKMDIAGPEISSDSLASRSSREKYPLDRHIFPSCSTNEGGESYSNAEGPFLALDRSMT